MKLKIIRLLLLSTAAVLLAGCGGGTEPVSSPTPYPTYTPVPLATPNLEATIEAKVKAVLTAVPTLTPTPVPSPTVTRTPIPPNPTAPPPPSIAAATPTLTNGRGKSPADATRTARLESGLPAYTPTPTPVPTATPTPTAVPTATKVPVKAALMQSLPVDVSAVLSAGPIANSLRTFAGYGMPKPHDPNQRIPQWEFTVPLGTPALSPISGTVFDVPTLWSDDYTVMIRGDQGGWIWEVEHVMNVEVSVGERVEAGQKIATASDFPERIDGKGFAIVELGLLEGGRVPTHHCPLLYIDQTVLLSITAGLDAIRQENLQRLDRQGLVSDPVNDPYGQACWTHDPILDYAYAE